MNIKFALIGMVTFLSCTIFILTPKTIADSKMPRPESHSIATAPAVETIDGLPVQRVETCIAGPIDIEGLIKGSELIVIGTIEESLKESKTVISRSSNGAPSSFASVVNFKINKVLKGEQNLNRKNIKIGQGLIITKGADKKPYILAYENIYPFKKKGRYLLFLTSGGSSTYYATTLFYGRHNLDGTDTSEENIDDLSFQEVRKLVRQRFKDG
jgi:hypothetical protein